MHKATGEPETAQIRSRRLMRRRQTSEAAGSETFVYEPTKKNIGTVSNYTFGKIRVDSRFGKIGRNALATSSRPNKNKNKENW